MGIFGISALAGLFVFATYSGSGGSGDAIGTVVVWGTLPKEGMVATLTQVAQSDTAMKGVSYVQKSPDTLAADLASAIATGAAPDLILASQEQLLALAKFLTPISQDTLPQSTFTETFVDEARLFTAPRGMGYYGVPFLVDPLILFWNNSILASSGIAKPPTTWEALIGLVPAVTTVSPTGQVTRSLIGLGTYNNVRNARAILSALFLQSGVPVSGYGSGGALVSDLGQTAASAAGAPLGQAVVTFYTTFADPLKKTYTWNTSLKDSQQAFLAGDLALYLGYASEARFLRAANPNRSFNVAPLPQIDTASTKSTYGLVYAFMIPRGARNPSGGYQAAATLTNNTEQAIASQITGLAPATLTMLSNPPSDPTLAVAYASALYAKGWLSPLPTDTDEVFSSMIGNVVNGRLDPLAALTRAQGSLTSLLQQ